MKKRKRNTPRKKPQKPSHLEETFLLKWKERWPNLPVPDRQVKFLADRKFLWDFSWQFPGIKLAVEIQGGGSRGRHASIKGQTADYEKFNLAQEAGWQVLLFNNVHMKDPDNVVDFVAAVLCRAKEV